MEIIKYGSKRKHPLYHTYYGMKDRCYCITSAGYAYYGAKGVKLCDRWLGDDGFQNFVNDMGPKPDKTYSIDRINPAGDYEPTNCRWADEVTQRFNTRVGSSRLHHIQKVTVTYPEPVTTWTVKVTNKKIPYNYPYIKSEAEAIKIRDKLLEDLGLSQYYIS